jgi:N-acetylmuramoyl-L-alanine amidase
MPMPEMPADLHNEESPIDILEEIIANQQIKNQGKDVKISEKPSKSEASGLHIVFKVQIAALINKRDVNHKVFMGLSGLSIEKSKEFNRYLYRPTRSYKQAEIAKKYVISKGFKKAFVVAYVNGIRTSAWEAAKWKQQAP